MKDQRNLSGGHPPAVVFNAVKDQDIPLIRDLAARIWREHYPGIITHGQIDYMLEKMYAADRIREEIRDQGYRYVLVMTGDLPAGFIAYVHEPSQNAVKISKLYLLPALHGKGIGQRMLDHVKNDALRLKAETIFLFVNKNNTRAIAAYERFGFVKAASLATDIGGGFVMDDFRMELSL